MNEQEIAKPQKPYLTLRTGSEVQYFALDVDTNTLVGSGGHCRIQLEGDEIRSLHCILALKEEGFLEVRDWYTGSTLLNGEAIKDSVDMREDDRLQVGSYEITVALESADQTETSPESQSESAADMDQDGEERSESALQENNEEAALEADRNVDELPVDEAQDVDEAAADVATVADESVATEPVDEAPVDEVPVDEVPVDEAPVDEVPVDEVPVDEVPVDEAPVDGETDADIAGPTEESEPALIEDSTPQPEQEPVVEPSREFVYDIDAAEEEMNGASAGFAAPAFNSDTSVDADELQLLRMEIDQLRFELAEKEAAPEQSPGQLSRDQTVKLVSRLEELLEELRFSDVRSQELEELLRTADQATCDEREERKQIESWVTDLEGRITQREEETEAEVQQLKKLLTEARASQQKSNECLKSVIDVKTQSGEAVPTELANDLKKQIESLQLQLQTAQEEATDLRGKLEEQAASVIPLQVQLNESEQQLAAMQLEAANERAEVSRQRVELQRLKTDLEGRLDSSDDGDNADSRIRAMREHLKELHVKDEENKQESKDNGGLANRITNLLQRVSSD